MSENPLLPGLHRLLRALPLCLAPELTANLAAASRGSRDPAGRPGLSPALRALVWGHAQRWGHRGGVGARLLARGLAGRKHRCVPSCRAVGECQGVATAALAGARSGVSEGSSRSQPCFRSTCCSCTAPVRVTLLQSHGFLDR